MPAVETEVSLTTGRPKNQPRTRGFVVILACCAALGGFIFGYDIGGAGGTFGMDGFRQHFGWDSNGEQVVSDSKIAFDKGMINGLFGVGAMLGALINPYLADRLGRRICLLISTSTFIVGAAIQVCSPASAMGVMWAGRVVGGIGIGMLSMCVPVYIGEASPAHIRGTLATLWQLATTFGILIASSANVGLEHEDWGWRVSYGGNILFALLLLVSLVFLPESPRWLAGKEKTEEMRAVLHRLRFEDEVEAEAAQLTAEVEEERHIGTASWAEIFSTANSLRYRLILGCVLQMFQQLSGINSVMFYAPDILKTFFSNTISLYGALGLNIVNFLATFITVYAIDRYGRVKLLLAGGVTMTAGCIAMCVLSAIPGNQTVGIVVIVCAAIFVISFAYSWGPIVWVVDAEIFPQRSRGKAVGLCTATNWLFTTVVGATFPIAQEASLAGCFAFFAVFIGLGSVCVYFFLPETANLSILQIDTVFHNWKPSIVRPGCCGQPAVDEPNAGKGGANNSMALEDPSKVPSSRYDRRTSEYHYDSTNGSDRESVRP